MCVCVCVNDMQLIKRKLAIQREMAPWGQEREKATTGESKKGQSYVQNMMMDKNRSDERVGKKVQVQRGRVHKEGIE